jgi:hypothetical protein
MPPVGFETTIPASARPQTYSLDRAATGIDAENIIGIKWVNLMFLYGQFKILKASLSKQKFPVVYTLYDALNLLHGNFIIINFAYFKIVMF